MPSPVCPDCVVKSSHGPAYRGASAELRRRAQMTPYRWEGDVEVLRCDDCENLFVTGEQLRRIQELRENEYHDGDAMRALHHGVAPPRADDGRLRKCPGCRGELFASKYKQTQIPTEICVDCGGLFLSEEALRDIEVLWELTRG